MKLLFEQNLSFKLCTRLADVFLDSSQARLLGLDQADDRTLWHAQVTGFTLVMHDTDFAERATLHGFPPKVILLRCSNQPAAAIEKLFSDHAEAITAFKSDDSAGCLQILSPMNEPGEP